MREVVRYLLTAWLLAAGVLVSADCPSHCSCEGQKMECINKMPDYIPNGVKNVTVNGVTLQDTLDFSNKGWISVRYLSMHINSVDPFLLVNMPVQMVKLEHLQLTCLCMMSFKLSFFHKLKNLKVLDLSNNVFTVDFLKNALINGFQYIPELEKLYLANTSVNGEFEIDKRFLQTVSKIPLKVLDISNTRHSFDKNVGEYLFQALNNLQILNMSRSPNALRRYFYNFDVTSTSVCCHFPGFMKLQTLDISDNEMLDFLYSDISRLQIPLWFFSTPLPDIYLRKVLTKHEFKIYVLLNATSGGGTCWYFETEGAHDLLRCFIGDLNIEKIDFADNLLVYIDPNSVKYIATLRYIDVSKNRLGDAFSKEGYLQSIIANLKRLEVFLVAENDIHTIPKDAFEGGIYIQELDISGNKLEAISFETKYLISLRKLCLGNNKIKAIEGLSLARLQQLKGRAAGSRKTEIYMEGNPLTCSCHNRKYLLWILIQNETAVCILNEERPIYENALGYTVFDCQETFVMAVFSVLAILEISISTIMAVFVVKETKAILRRQRIKAAIKHLRRSRNERSSPPVFLSFCSEDDDIVMEDIAPKLDEGLKELLNTDEKCVATGYNEFQPGLPIATEIIRCIEDSYVVVFFVTNAFCKRQWCKNEALVAHYENKPIILMIWEQLDLKSIPKYMYHHYKNNTRVHWIQENGRRVMKPGWNKLCEAIIRLLAEREYKATTTV